MSSILKRISKKDIEREKYSYISNEKLESLKYRALAIKEEMIILSKEVSFKNVKKVSELTKEFAYITKELQKYKKYSKEREEIENKS